MVIYVKERNTVTLRHCSVPCRKNIAGYLGLESKLKRSLLPDILRPRISDAFRHVGETFQVLVADDLILDLTAEAPDSLCLRLYLRFFDSEIVLDLC